MRDISMDRVNETRKNILYIIENKSLTHEQKIHSMASAADSLLEVLDLPEGLEELMNAPAWLQCIDDMGEGHAPMRPCYIIPDYALLMRKGCEFLQLEPPTDLYEAINTLLIFYHHVPSVTNYPSYLGQLDQLLEPFIDTVDENTARRLLRMFFLQIDRTFPHGFCHADIGPIPTRTGRMILDIQRELRTTVPNVTLRYEEHITDDEFALAAIDCSLQTGKPSFANDSMFRKELGDDYVISSCYDGLIKGGGAYTLCRMILGNVARRSSGIRDFEENQLPYVMNIMARYMDARIAFEVEQSGFYESSFLVKEGFIRRDQFTGMFGIVGLADAVNILLTKEGRTGRFGHNDAANDLGVEIMDIIKDYVEHHKNPYCEATGRHFLLHAQVGLPGDVSVTPGTRVPIGEEPQELVDHLFVLSRFHKYFVAGTGDLFPFDLTVHHNPEFILDVIKGSFCMGLRYISFYASDSDMIRVTGYLIKRSEVARAAQGEQMYTDTTAGAVGYVANQRVLERKVR